MKVGKILAVQFFLIAAAACGRGGPVESDPSPEAARTAHQLANATYSGITNEPVALTDGRWEGEPYANGGASRPTAGLVDHFVLTGDLDNDGADEIAALLWESSGGSGTRLFLAIMGIRDGEFTNLATTPIGDRVQVQSGGIEDGLINLNVIRAGPEDGACCPTQKALVSWALSEDGLSLVADKPIGTLSLADLGGGEWALLELGRGQPLPEDVEISLVFQDDRVSGRSGCNNYFAGVTEVVPGQIAFNGMGATRMACPEPVMDVERRYLNVLARASNYSFLGGRLVLGCDTDKGPQALVFTSNGGPRAEIRE